MACADQKDPSAELLLKVGAGDTAAFNAIVARWKNPLISFFQRSVGSRADAEDLAISTLTKIYFNAASYRPSGSFPAYVFTIARRQLISFHRKNQARPQLAPAKEMPELTAPTAHQQETEEWLEQGLKQLPEKGRTALLLFAQQGLTYAEIADTLNQSLAATKVQIHRARQQLKSILESCTQ